jgi:PIN domain nuclease of toxin-antitoxin system
VTTDVVVLDTHVLVWLLEGDRRLSIKARDAIGAASRVCLSAITPWEIGMLAAKGRLGFGDQDVQQWIDEVLALPAVHLIPLLPSIAIASSRLPGELHGDPADRLIAATARHLDAVLVTADGKLLAYGATGHLRVLAAT